MYSLTRDETKILNLDTLIYGKYKLLKLKIINQWPPSLKFILLKNQIKIYLEFYFLDLRIIHRVENISKKSRVMPTSDFMILRYLLSFLFSRVALPTLTENILDALVEPAVKRERTTNNAKS